MDEKKREEIALFRYSLIVPFLSQEELATALQRTVESLHAHEITEMQRTWDTFGPFDPALIHIALAKAIIHKKHDQHISF
ncbi:hypothetical protein JW960_21200 [candidate division KSB1 bacterium]|nr:hypothetical protein [candidate division KSB1 bacterium]